MPRRYDSMSFTDPAWLSSLRARVQAGERVFLERLPNSGSGKSKFVLVQAVYIRDQADERGQWGRVFFDLGKRGAG